jgi:3-oxoadipate enol-lactonase
MVDFLNTPAVQAYALQAARQITRADFATIWQAITLAVNEKGEPALRIDVPLLLIHGENDRGGTIRRDMPQWAKWGKEVTYQDTLFVAGMLTRRSRIRPTT